jgi:hypothetical protein
MSRAFGTIRRQGLAGDLWAIPAATLGYMPIIIAAALTRRAATNRDKSAILIFYPNRRSFMIYTLTAVLWFGATACAIRPTTDFILSALGSRTPLWIGATALVLAFGGALVPAMVDASVQAIRGFQPDAVSTLHHATRLRRTGARCAAISSWSAWPPRRGTGRRLADELLHRMPSDVTLVATARNTAVAQWLSDRGFTPTGRGLLMERAGDTPADT